MYTKILVPYDKSESSRHALTEALKLADDNPDAKVTVLNVVNWREYDAETFKIASRMAGVVGDYLDMNAIASVGEEAAKDASKKITEELADVIGDSEIVDVAVINGSEHDSITAYALNGGYDCIVMGYRGQGSVRGMLGSVCYSVLHKFDKPVVIVK